MHGSPQVWEPPLAKPLDEAVWQAWLLKGRAQDRQSSAARIKAVKWTSLVGLLAVAALWSHITPYQEVIRFIVAASAMVLAFQAFHSRHYAFATVFGALALLYNPLAPVFNFSGDWQQAVVAASATPFITSFASLNGRTAHNV